MSENERSIDMVEGDDNTVFFTRIAPEFKSPYFDPLIDSDAERTIFELLEMGQGSMKRAVDMVFEEIDEEIREQIEKHKKDFKNSEFEPTISDENRLGVLMMPEEEYELVH